METPKLKPRSIRPEQSGSLQKLQRSENGTSTNVRKETSQRSLSADHSVSSSGLAGFEQAHLDNCTAKERFRKDQFWVKDNFTDCDRCYQSSCGTLTAVAFDLLPRSQIWTGLQLVSGSDRRKSSYKEHRVDALAPYAEEGRGKLRKATGSRKQAPIRRHPNGGTRQVKNLSP